MHPHISQLLAEQHTRDLQHEATRAYRARQARRARRAQNALGKVRMRVPESYDDFLCQAAESVMHEPTTSGRVGGQKMR